MDGRTYAAVAAYISTFLALVRTVTLAANTSVKAASKPSANRFVGANSNATIAQISSTAEMITLNAETMCLIVCSGKYLTPSQEYCLCR